MGKLSYLLASSRGRSEVRISHRAALLDLVGIQCPAQGHFITVETCQYKARTIAFGHSEISLHGILRTALCALFCVFLLFTYFAGLSATVLYITGPATVHRPHRVLH